MVRHLSAAIALTVLVGFAAAQDEQPPKPVPKPEPGRITDYRDFFTKPTNTLEYWKALQFEIEVGRYDLAAKHLRGLMDPPPDEKTLVAIANKEGLSAFLALRNVPKWSEVAKENTQAKDDVKKLIETATTALRKALSTEENVTKYVRNLSGEPEQRAFAVGQLYRIGADAVPYLVDALLKAGEEERANLIYALENMGKDAVPPLLAALDVPDPKIKLELIGILEKRAETSAVPWLWHLANSKNQPDFIRDRARGALALLLQTDQSLLPPAKEMLTKEAERYYQRKVRFPDPEAVTVWRWDNGQLVPGWPGAAVVPPSKAEEYYGLRFAGQALDLDPQYKPAQNVFLSLALEKGVERAGLDKPLLVAEPRVHDLLTQVNPELVTTILERGLADQNLPVILGATRALGELAEIRAARPTAGGEAALVKALYYPNPRVSFAAAEALLRMPRLPVPDEARRPGVTSTPPHGRIVQILDRAVAARPSTATAKVLVVHNSLDVLAEIERGMKAAGLEAETFRTGREGLRRLNQASDLAAIFVDANVPDPLLPYFLGQVRSDVNAGLLPVFVLTPPDRELSLKRMTDRYRNVHLIPPSFAIDPDFLKKVVPVLITDAVGKPLSEGELTEYGERSLSWLAKLAQSDRKGFELRSAGDAVLQVLRNNRYSPIGQINAIAFASRLPGAKTQEVLAGVVTDPNRAPPVRFAAAQGLTQNVQDFGGAVPPNLVKALLDTYAGTDTEPPLRSQIAVVLGSLRPTSEATGAILKSFQPPPPAPPMPPPMPPMPPPAPPKDN